jgi:hypothetical protein
MWSISSLSKIPNNVSVCSSLNWLKAALDVKNVKAIIFKNGGCFFPAGIVRRNFIKVLEGLGAERRSSSGFIFCDDRDNHTPLTSQDIPANIDLIDFRRIPESELDLCLPLCTSRHVSLDGARYFLTLQGGWEDYQKSLKKKFRQNIQGSKNRLARDFLSSEVEFQTFEVTNENWSTVIEWWHTVDCESWQGKKGLTALHNRSKIEFLKRLVTGNMHARVFLIFIRKKPIAIRWFFSLRDHGLFYSIQFNESYGRYRPGHLLTAEAIKYCFENNIKYLDFGHGDSAHKKDWRADRVPLVRLLIPCTYKGKIFLLYQQTRWLVGHLLKGIKVHLKKR